MNAQRNMEQDVITRFSCAVQTRFRALHAGGTELPYVVGSALCGQDRALADYLFGARGRFALIEFKAGEAEMASELDKPARRRLLGMCRADTGILARARAIHFLAWERLDLRDLPGLGRQAVASIEVARYLPEVAKASRMALHGALPRRWQSEAFIASYLEAETAGANIRRFRRYLEELYSIAGKNGASELGKFEGTVLVYLPALAGAAQLQTIRFGSFEHLMELTLDHERSLQREQSRADRSPGLER